MAKRSRSAIWAGLVGVSALLWVGLSLCFVLRPDSCAAVTVWPAWAWAVPGLFLLLAGRRACSRKVVLAVLALWAIYILAFCEEPRSLLYTPIRNRFVSAPQYQRLRVVSINCSAGSADAAAEVLSYHPDIVLLQESPSRDQVKALTAKLYGDKGRYAWGVDGSVLFSGRGEALPSLGRLGLIATQAQIGMQGRLPIRVCSLRLTPPASRFDVWAPSYWKEQSAMRRTHRQQLRLVARQMDELPSDAVVIAGGDFNAPSGDGAMGELMPRLRDAFDEGGAWWGNTVLNEFPISRFDQVWVSKQFRVLSVRALRTRHSDHRLVVCDLALLGPKAK